MLVAVIIIKRIMTGTRLVIISRKIIMIIPSTCRPHPENGDHN